MLAVGYWDGCTLHVDTMSYLVHYVCWDLLGLIFAGFNVCGFRGSAAIREYLDV